MEKITIIDDDAEVRATLEGIFQSYGFVTASFANPVEALEAPLDEPNSCILLDLNMPEMDGLEVQAILNKKGIHTPVIVYTGSVDVAGAVNAMSAGAFTLIQKPAPNHLLIKKVREAVAQANICKPRDDKIRDAQNKLAQLSERERQVADMVADGQTSSAIAEKLFISKRTVDIHRAHIFEKLEIKSIANLIQLVLLAKMAST